MFSFQSMVYFQNTALNSLKRWSELNRSSITAPTAYTSLTRQHSPFPHREDINGRFILWEGDISLLNADCITNTTNERLSEANTVSNRIVGRAGVNLLEELKAIKGIIMTYEKYLPKLDHSDSFQEINLLSQTNQQSNKAITAISILVCRPGEVKVSKGHLLAARYIIHTVCPIYSEKNRTASIWAENTLQSCYRYNN